MSAPTQPWKCDYCGSPRWVSVSHNGGLTRIAQCVPCGRYGPLPAETEPVDTANVQLSEEDQRVLDAYTRGVRDGAQGVAGLNAVGIEQATEQVLIAHQRRDIKGCSCGRWGSDHGHLGQSHAGHLLAELRKAGLEVHRAR